jgi:hypothetical protein
VEFVKYSNRYKFEQVEDFCETWTSKKRKEKEV